MRQLRPEESVALFAGVFLLFASAGQLLPMNSLGLVLRQIAFFAVPVVLVVRWRGVPLRSGLGLIRPRPAAFAGAALIGISLWYIGIWITVWAFSDVASDPERLEEVRRVTWEGDPALVKLLAVAMVPAVCEELLVRGAVARSLRPALGLVGAVVLSALLFAILHQPLMRMLPAGVLGLALGYAAVVTDSVYPAMLMHFLNNLIAAVLLPEIPALGDAIDGHPTASGVGAIALTAFGAALLWRSRVKPAQ